MINLGGVTHDFIDTEYCWSLSLKGAIDILTVDVKSKKIFIIESLMAMISGKTLYFYKYNVRKPK
jgi:hypothetical protein